MSRLRQRIGALEQKAEPARAFRPISGLSPEANALLASFAPLPTDPKELAEQLARIRSERELRASKPKLVLAGMDRLKATQNPYKDHAALIELRDFFQAEKARRVQAAGASSWEEYLRMKEKAESSEDGS